MVRQVMKCLPPVEAAAYIVELIVNMFKEAEKK
jgi:ethanolamine ammonia-lyase small subunit